MSLVGALASGPANAFLISFSSSDFGQLPVFSDVQRFVSEIEVDPALLEGPYTNPNIAGVDYAVSGSLDGHPMSFSRRVDERRNGWRGGVGRLRS